MRMCKCERLSHIELGIVAIVAIVLIFGVLFWKAAKEEKEIIKHQPTAKVITEPK